MVRCQANTERVVGWASEIGDSNTFVESGVERRGSLGQLVQLMMLLCVDPLMLLEILWSLERLATDGTWVWFQRRVD
jgi:hypothetical protein